MAITDGEYRELRYRVEQQGQFIQELTRVNDARPSLAQIGTVAGQVTTVSTSYVSLTGGPTVTATIRASGKALATVGCFVSAIANMTAFMSFKSSGANALSTALSDFDQRSLACGSANSADGIRAVSMTLLTGMTPGVTVFTAQYSQSLPGATDSAVFTNRLLSVEPL